MRRRAGRPLDTQSTRKIVSDYMAWEVVTNTGDSVLEGLEIRERYKVSFWDALIIHSADASAASVLYSVNLSSGQVFGSVKVVNPLE